MAADHAHEMTNKVIKGNGGAIGLFQNREQVTKWLIVTPELARLVQEFERQLPSRMIDDGDLEDLDFDHHEATQGFQRKFHERANRLYSCVKDLGNPFSLEDTRLLKLHTQDALESAVAESMQTLERKGQEQYAQFVRDVLENGSKSIYDVIPKNSFPLISTPLKKVETATGSKLKTVQVNNSIFSQTVAVLQQREISLKKMFAHEFNHFPPSLSNSGEMNYPSNKASLIHEILTDCHNAPDEPSEFDPTSAVLIDGGRLLHQFPPRPLMTFRQYAEMLSKGPISLYLQHHQRMDIVFDTYIDGSLNAATRQGRGKGLRRRVAAETKCPAKWSQFLKDTRNKKELNIFLAQQLTTYSYPEGRQFFATCEEKVLSNTSFTMADSDQEGADTRLMLHAKHCLSEGLNRIKILIDDTDVIVIALGIFHKLQSSYHFDDIVIEFGINKNHRSVSLKALANSLGPSRCLAIPLLHTLSGSESTSALKGIGKKKAYEALKAYKESEAILGDYFSNAFKTLNEGDSAFKTIQRLVILMYARTSILESIDDLRMELYFQRSQNIELIPPTSNALYLHTLRCIYQAGVWSLCLLPFQNRPSPCEYGWHKTNHTSMYQPVWITKGEAIKECREFVKCSCKSEICTRCKCKNAILRCTLLCSCKCDDRVSFD